jgi:hypothetical protein
MFRIQHLFQEQRHASLALFEAAHEQRGQRHQSRTALADRHARGKPGASAGRASATRQPVQLVLRHQRFDLGNVPHLMSQWLGVAAGQPFAAAAAGPGLHGDDRLTLIRGDQRPLVLEMSRLAARLPAALAFLGLGLCMRMLAARRQRRVSRRLVQTRFKFGDLRQQQPNNRLRLRRLPGDQFLRDQWLLRHATGVADFASRAKINWLAPRRNRGVNGYQPACNLHQSACAVQVNWPVPTVTGGGTLPVGMTLIGAFFSCGEEPTS